LASRGPGGVEGSLKRLYEDPRTLLGSRAERADLQAEMLAETASVLARPVVAAGTGCGDGRATAVVMARCKRTAGAQVSLFGLDWSREALEKARRSGVRVVRASISGSRLPPASGSVEVVIMSELIEHLVDTDAVLDEAAKVLVPGEAVVVDAQSGCLAQQGTPRGRRSARLCRGQPVRHLRPPGHEVVGHLSVFTRRALEQLLVVAGFVDIEITGPLITSCRGRCARSTACFVAHRAVRRSFSRPRGGRRER